MKINKTLQLNVAIPLNRVKVSIHCGQDVENPVEQVAIPLNRVKVSIRYRAPWIRLLRSRNPLKSGQGFNLNTVALVKLDAYSRNPLKSGQGFNFL